MRKHTSRTLRGQSSEIWDASMHPGWLSRVARVGLAAGHPPASSTQRQDPETPDQVADSQESSQDLSDSVSEALARVWWARNLVHHSQSLGFRTPEGSQEPVRVASACTGSFAEGACFKDRLLGFLLALFAKGHLDATLLLLINVCSNVAALQTALRLRFRFVWDLCQCSGTQDGGEVG